MSQIFRNFMKIKIFNKELILNLNLEIVFNSQIIVIFSIQTFNTLLINLLIA
jgi:hypothetical protein